MAKRTRTQPIGKPTKARTDMSGSGNRESAVSGAAPNEDILAGPSSSPDSQCDTAMDSMDDSQPQPKTVKPKPVIIPSNQPPESVLRALGLKIHDYAYDPRFPKQKGWRPKQYQPIPPSHLKRENTQTTGEGSSQESQPSQPSQGLEAKATEPMLCLQPVPSTSTQPDLGAIQPQATSMVVDTPPASPMAPPRRLPPPPSGPRTILLVSQQTQFSARSAFISGMLNPSPTTPTSPMQAALLGVRPSLKRGTSTNPSLTLPTKSRKGKARELNPKSSPRSPRYALRSHVPEGDVPSERKRSLRNYVEGGYQPILVQSSCPKRKTAVSDTPRARPISTNEAKERPTKRRRGAA
ncbi:hypothetical protein FA15DRAFT_657589 [Coprinopsis marcescibilis]|uniref:Uncharacterized protein n=1 Tax=Coprinopsis marcescibilis TaxID=230819 RepID=A0A5C3KQ55_COPMA|nr:hypothetical protein FA15DRAFT_657589 [Coprinopsis marcescibilis]